MTTKGQILEHSSFAYYIDQTIEHNLPKNIVEVGTWKGLGSTKRIIDAIIKNNLSCNFISIETNIEFHNEAKDNLNQYQSYVKLMHGKIVEINEMQEFLSSIELNNNEKEWLSEDIVNMSKTPNIFDLLPEKIDFLLLDGGEFSTYAEWKKLKDKSKIVALDDTNVTKCKKIKEEILSQTNLYEIIIESNDRNGFMFFKNRNL